MSYIGITRVTNQMQTNSLLSTLGQTNLSLALLQQQIATGNRLISPDIDPAAADASFSLQRNIEQQTQVLNNIQAASPIFSESDSALGDATDEIRQAITLAQSTLDSGTEQASRDTVASQIGEISQSLLDIANTKVGDVYVFGGTANTSTPFVSDAAGIGYKGTLDGVQGLLGGSGLTQIGATGNQAFGALSSQVAGYRDLRPAMTDKTRLMDLDGASGDGIRLGTIVLGDNAHSVQVDLSGCDCIGDVMQRINDAGGGFTAHLSGDGQRLVIDSASPGLTVTELGASRAAHDLGIYRSTDQGQSFTGDSVGPRVTMTTTLSSLKAGAGIDTNGGLLITDSGKTATVDVSSCQTVGDLINAINSADIGVQARINATGDGIDIVNTLSGAEMRIGENGGTTADDLGVRSLQSGTLLSDLNDGVGVRRIAGQADFRITAADGSTFDISLGAAATIGDVLGAINNATGGKVTAALATVGNGITLTDNSGGAGTLNVVAMNASDAASDLGILGNATGTTLQGSDVNPICPSGVFAHLSQLADVLSRTDMDVNQRAEAVNHIVDQLNDDENRVVNLRAQMGGLVQEMESRQQTIEDGNTASQTQLSQLKDTDMTSAISQLQALQTAMQANLIASSKILGTSLLDFLGTTS